MEEEASETAEDSGEVQAVPAEETEAESVEEETEPCVDTDEPAQDVMPETEGVDAAELSDTVENEKQNKAADAVKNTVPEGEWTEVTETVHYDEKGHYERRKTGEKEVIDKKAYDEKIKVFYKQCSCCDFRTKDIDEIYNHIMDHSSSGEIFYDMFGGELRRIIPSFRTVTEYETVHHDAETHMEDIYEDVWVVDKAACDKIVGTGEYVITVNGATVTDTLVSVDGDVYYVDKNSRIATGWVQTDGGWMFFGEDGKRHTGWVEKDGHDAYADPETGSMAVSTVFTVDGTPYYFNSEGEAFAKGVVTENGKEYYFDGEELVKDAWAKTGAGMCYFDADGRKVTGVVEKGGKVFPVGDDGTAKPYSWVTVDGGKYYTDNTGAAVTGWQTIGEERYYFADESCEGYRDAVRGVMLSGWRTIGGKSYYFMDKQCEGFDPAKRGTQATGFTVVNKKRYYFMDENCAHYSEAKRGLKLTGWRTVGGVRYYIKDSGVVAKGVTVIAGKTYIFSDDGRQLKRGIVSANGGRYFVNLNGIVQKSRWLNVGGKKYYALWNGRLKTGLLKKDGKEYFFGDDGALVTNAKVQAGGTTRYADRNGVLR